MSDKPNDYRSAIVRDDKGNIIENYRDKNKNNNSISFNWWDCDEAERPQKINSAIKFMAQHQSARLEQLNLSSKLYGGGSTMNLFGFASIAKSVTASQPSLERLSFNLCSSIVDTLTSKMAKNKVVPTFVTNGGDWKAQKKAKNLTKFTQGLFYKHKIHTKLIEMFGDACVWGDGFLRPYKDGTQLCIERVLPHEIWIDQVEGAVSHPQTMHRVKIMDRGLAKEMFKDLSDAIEKSNQDTYMQLGSDRTVADLVVVIESWKLKEGEKPGLHAITIGDESISEEYDKAHFPFVHFRYSKRKVGWYGQGAVERVQNLQAELNRLMILKQRSMWMMGSFKILIENGSKIVTQHLNNEVATIITYSNTKPEYIVPPSINPEIQMSIDRYIQMAYEQEGISKLATTGQVPLGIDSGKALRTLDQIGDDRFLFAAQNLEEASLTFAHLCIDVAKEIYEQEGKFKVNFIDNYFSEEIDWKDIKLDEDAYTIKAFPTNSLSNDLAGRLKDIQELTQAGFIDPMTAKKLLDAPDLEMYEAISNSSYDLTCKKIEEALFEGKFWTLEPYHNIDLADKLSIQYYNWAQYHNCPEEELQVLRDIMNQIQEMKQTMQAQAMQIAQAQAQAEAQGPQAIPEKSPKNDLLQNSPKG